MFSDYRSCGERGKSNFRPNEMARALRARANGAGQHRVQSSVPPLSLGSRWLCTPVVSQRVAHCRALIATRSPISNLILSLPCRGTGRACRSRRSRLACFSTTVTPGQQTSLADWGCEKGQRWPALVTARDATDVLFLCLLGLLCLLCHVSLLFPEIGKSGICLEPITGTNSFLSESRANSKILANNRVASSYPRSDGYAWGGSNCLGGPSLRDETVLAR